MYAYATFDTNKVITEYSKDIFVMLSSINQAERSVVTPPPPTSSIIQLSQCNIPSITISVISSRE